MTDLFRELLGVFGCCGNQQNAIFADFPIIVVYSVAAIIAGTGINRNAGCVRGGYTNILLN